MLQPFTQRADPAFPATAIAATGNRIFHGLPGDAKTFVACPFEQPMEKGARVRATGESMDIGTAGHHLSRGMRVGTFVVEEFLCLCTFGRLITADTQAVADAQGAVRSNPPVFTGLALHRQRRQQRRGVLRGMVRLEGGLGHFAVADRRTALLQVP
ncbi:hypothetical protein D9M71_670600 [compost metagenome]